jgi:hypothetical protein
MESTVESCATGRCRAQGHQGKPGDKRPGVLGRAVTIMTDFCQGHVLCWILC